MSAFLITPSLFNAYIYMLMWSLVCPFSARKVLSTQWQANCLHVVVVLVSIVPPVAILAGTFGAGDYATNFPPQVCAPDDTDTVYYFFILLECFIIIPGLTCFVITLWLLIRRKKIGDNVSS